ncbi:oxidative damage protection protein [Legionella yabuuchiae]|uniref:oxidative damage protection protein n=1 Tax=Legionella yabuuchiae TaxID=376727 RepID=UPI001056DF4F|nr:oxidative damage protection protein [Legionella yabuuchiae]
MAKQIFCVKLNREADQMDSPPFPGPLGERIFNHISKQAWGMWLDHQTMLINEYRLSMVDPQARSFLREEMEKFFFGEGSEKPSGFNLQN